MTQFFALVLLASTPVWAFAGPVIPSAEDRETLAAAIDAIDVVRAQDQAQGRGIMQKVEKMIGLRDEDGKLLRPGLSDPNYFVVTSGILDRQLGRIQQFDAGVAARFAGLSEQERVKYDAATKAHKRYQEELRPLCAEALVIAQKAFHISPRHAEGTIVNGPPPPKTDDDFPSFQGKHAVWNPVFHETQDPINRGFTDPDGHVGITLEAFRDADRLGFVLYHESLHFDDLLNAAQNIKNDPADEVRHREGAKRLIGSVFVLRADDIVNNDAVIEAEKPNAEKWRQSMANGFDPWKKSQRALFPGNYKSLWMKTRAPNDGEEYSGRPEPAKEQADISFLDSWRQAVAPLVDKAKAAQALQEAERQARERERERVEREDQERRAEEARLEEARQERAGWAKLDDIAARCGYQIDTSRATTMFIGENESFAFDRRYKTDLDFDDVRIALLIKRACHDAEIYNGRTAAPSCKDASTFLTASESKPGFPDRFEYMFGTRENRSRCVNNIYDRGNEIRDSASFDKVMADFQKQLLKEKREHDKNYPSRRPERENPPSGGGGSLPPADDNRGCFRNGDPFGCQPR